MVGRSDCAVVFEGAVVSEHGIGDRRLNELMIHVGVFVVVRVRADQLWRLGEGQLIKLHASRRN